MEKMEGLSLHFLACPAWKSFKKTVNFVRFVRILLIITRKITLIAGWLNQKPQSVSD